MTTNNAWNIVFKRLAGIIFCAILTLKKKADMLQLSCCSFYQSSLFIWYNALTIILKLPWKSKRRNNVHKPLHMYVVLMKCLSTHLWNLTEIRFQILSPQKSVKICHLKKALLPKSIKIIDLWYLSKGLCIWRQGHAGTRATHLPRTDLLRVYMRQGKLLQLWKNHVLYTLISLWPVHIIAWLSFVPPALPSYKQIPLPYSFL